MRFLVNATLISLLICICSAKPPCKRSIADKIKDKIPDGVKDLPGKIKDKLPGSVGDVIPDSVKGLPDKVKGLPGAIKDKMPDVKGAIPDSMNPFKCAEGKQFLLQGPTCQLTCEKLLDIKKRGIDKINPLCMLKRPGCFCTGGYILNKEDNSCISQTKCLGKKVFG